MGPVVAQRNFVIDAVRAVAIVTVVTFHASLYQPHLHDGAFSATPYVAPVWGWVLSWPLMPMAAFFVAGGYANAVSVDRLHTDGTGYAHYLAKRGRRLVIPLALFVTFGSLVSTAVALAGFPDVAALIGDRLPQLLWFIAVYLLIVVIAPSMVRLHDRYGLLVPLAMAAGSVVVDLISQPLDAALVSEGLPGLSLASLQWFVIWPLCHQLGIAYHRGWLRHHWRQPVVAIVVGASVIGAGVAWGVFPPSAVQWSNVVGGNVMPPTLAMAALAVAQTGVMSLAARVPWLREPPGWARRIVAAANILAMTIYLWHIGMIAIAFALTGTLAWLTGSDVWFSGWIVVPLVWALVVTVVPQIARLENRLTPDLGSVWPGWTTTGALVSLAGAWMVWRHGMLLWGSSALAAAGVALVWGGAGVLSVGVRGGLHRSPTPIEAGPDPLS